MEGIGKRRDDGWEEGDEVNTLSGEEVERLVEDGVLGWEYGDGDSDEDVEMQEKCDEDFEVEGLE